jgi:hypothetical protein
MLLLAALPACGGDGPAKSGPAAPLRVEVMYASVDAAGPVEGFSLVGEGGKTWPLVSQPALDPRVLAADAPGGRYRVAGPAGWAPVGPLEPLALRGDVPPSSLWVGRTHSVYLLHPQELPVQQIDARPETRETGPRTFVPRLETGNDGRSALRVPPEQWDGTFRLQVRLGPTHFSKPIRVHLRGDGAPIHAVTEPALMTTFDVLALPPDGVPAAGVEVAGVSRIAGLEARVVAKTNASGWVRLDPVPVEVETFSLEVGSHVWRTDVFRRWGEGRLLAPPADPVVQSGIAIAWPPEGALVQVRHEGSDTYAVAPGAWAGRAFSASLRPGRFRWIATNGTSAAFGGPVEVTLAAVHVVTPAPMTLSSLAVHLRGGFLTKEDRYDLHARRLEDGKEVSVVGGTLRNLLRRDADLSLPPGHYRVRLSHGASESAAKDVDLSIPGTRASIDLDAPR